MLIAYLDARDSWADVARAIVEDFVRTGRNPAVVSTLSVMETLVRPMRHVPPGQSTVIDFFSRWPNLDVVPADMAVAQEAASIRAHHGFRAPDALVIGTGIVAGVSHLVTGDERWKKRLGQIETRIGTLYLGDLVAG